VRHDFRIWLNRAVFLKRLDKQEDQSTTIGGSNVEEMVVPGVACAMKDANKFDSV
jgi:hypothetical protein